MKNDDIQLAIRVTGSRNPYILACWLSEYRYGWTAGDMAEVKEALGIDPRQVDNEVKEGVGSLLADGRMPRRRPMGAFHKTRKQKEKIDEELQGIAH